MSQAVAIPAVTVARPRRLLARMEQAIARHESLCVAAGLATLAACVSVHMLYLPIWFDECFTLFISRLPHLHQMLPAMPADSQPPLQYLLTHLSISWFGETEYALRLPELLAYLATGFLVYRIARRHGTAIQALLAMACFLYCPMNKEQASIARPYELLVCFSALVFFCWQSAALDHRRRWLPLGGLSLGLAAAVFSQHLSVVDIGLFLLAGETTRLVQRRRIDFGMLAAILLGFVPLIWTVPIARQTMRILGDPTAHSKHFWMHPTFSNLSAVHEMLPLYLIGAIILLSVVLLLGRRAPALPMISPRVPAHERVAVAALCLILPLQILLSRFEHGYFWPRYAIDATIGLALLCAWGLPAIGRLRHVVQPAIAICLAVLLLWSGLWLLAVGVYIPASSYPKPRQRAVPAILANAPGDGPIAIGSSFDYYALWWYSPPRLRQRFVYLRDSSYAIQQPDFIAEFSMAADRDLLPPPIADFSTFAAAHDHFLLYSSGPPRLDVGTRHLRDTGWLFTPLSQSMTGTYKDVLYRVDRPVKSN